MRCPECDHENTEGAWLCINCGAKLPRPEAEAKDDPDNDNEASTEVAAEAVHEDPSRFTPRISESLRRLRDQTEQDRSQSAPPETKPHFLGIPGAVWAFVVTVAIIFTVAVSSLQ